MEWIYFITGFVCSLMMFAIPSYYRGKRLMTELGKTFQTETKAFGHIGASYRRCVLKDDGKVYLQQVLERYHSPEGLTFEERLSFEYANAPEILVIGEMEAKGDFSALVNKPEGTPLQ